MFEGESGAPADGSAANAGDGERPIQLAQAPGEPIGTIEELAGTVTLTRADGSSANAAAGDPVYLDDTVTTSPDGSVEIIFVDGTRFSLGQNGEMTLDTLVYDPAGSSNELDLSVVQGAFTFVTGAIAGAPGEGMEVNVPVGTIGIRGTAVGGGPDTQTPDPTDYTIVLLPETGGRVGRIVLTDVNGRAVILDAPLEAMDISTLGLAPGEPVQLTRDQVLDLLGSAVENIEDVLDEIQNLESPEEEQTPEAGPEQRGDVPSAPNTGGVNEQAGETQSLDELTSLFSLSDEQGFRDREVGPLGGFTPGGGLGDSDTPGGPQDNDDGGDQDQPVDTPVEPTRTVITGGPGDDQLDSGGITGPVEIIGLAGNDTLIGSDGDDILNGGDGDDVLDPGAGNDQAFGGGGNDLLIGGSGQGDDHLDGGDGTDTVKYSSATQSITVNLTTGAASGDPAIGNDTLVDVENVIGGQGSDTIIGDAEANVLEGGGGGDILMGLGGDDTLDGGTGTDTAAFTGNRSDYLIEAGAEGGLLVTDLRADGDGVDTLANIEFLSFADQTVSVDEIFGEQDATGGAAMKTTVTVGAGAVLTLRFNFLDSEPPGAEPSFKDFAVVLINGQAFKLADVDDATGAIGNTTFGFNDQTGYGTFTFTFNQAGTYTLGIAVMNEGDFAYDAGLLVDDVSITGGAFGDGFEDSEDPLGQWETLGNVTVQGAVGGVAPAGGEQQALMVSAPASATQIEAFLGVSTGTLSIVANQPVAEENIEYDEVGNAVPVAVDDPGYGTGYEFTTEEDEDFVAIADQLLANDSDADGDPLSVTAVGNAVGGTVALGAEGVITFTPEPDYSGPASFEYTVSDGNGGTDTATVHLTVLPVNDAPDITSDDGEPTAGLAVFENEAAVTIVTADDPDAGQILTFSVVGGADAALFEIDAESGELKFATAPDFETSADADEDNVYEVTVQVDDGVGGTDTQAISVAVTDVNEAPVAEDDAGYEFSMDEDTDFAVFADQLLANDSDPDGDQLVVTDVGDAVGGTVTLGAEGVITFTPEEDYSGPASFAYTVSDGNGGTDTATVHLTVMQVNDAPTDLVDEDGTENSVSRYASAGAAVGITAKAVDPEGGDLTYSLDDPSGIFAIDPSTGIVTVANRDLLQSTASQSLAITIIASDAGGLTSSEAFFVSVTNDGTAGDDVLEGTENADQIHGLAGNDIISGLAGNDMLYGDEGDDVIAPGQGYDFADGGTGNDTADFSDLTGTAILVDLGEGTAADDLGVVDTLSGIENVVGTSFHDLISGNEDVNYLAGGAGNDMLMAAGTGDILDGGVGNDTLSVPNLSFDYVDGGEGTDTLAFQVSGLTIDLADNHDIRNVERIDLTGSNAGGNMLTVNAADVLEDFGGTLTVLGDQQDTVTFSDQGWELTDEVVVGDVLFNVYANGGAQLVVEADINTNVG